MIRHLRRGGVDEDLLGAVASDVAEINGVRWYNDSKATNAEATAVALASFEGGIYWIAGGRLLAESEEIAGMPGPQWVGGGCL